MVDISVFEFVETRAAHLRRARQVQRLLASRSQRGRKVPDLLIAAAAEQAALSLLHYDNDFELIAKATVKTYQWVLPRHHRLNPTPQLIVKHRFVRRPARTRTRPTETALDDNGAIRTTDGRTERVP